MRKNILLTFLLLTFIPLSGCMEEEPAYKQKASSPSPLMSIEEDRRWILIKSGYGFNTRCNDLYRYPDDPRYISLAEFCYGWENDTVEYLKQNGLSTMEAAHLREAGFWEWEQSYFKKIMDCRKAARKSKENTKFKFEKCDPWKLAKATHKKEVRKALNLTDRDNPQDFFSREGTMSLEPIKPNWGK